LTLEQQQQQLCAVFVDFTKAYDSVLRGKLWKILKSFGVPEFFICRINALHRNTSVKVRIGGLFGEEFRTKLGLRQGCVMAPVLFNIYLDHVLKQLPKRTGVNVEIVQSEDLVVPNSYRLKTEDTVVICDTRFADDIALLSKSSAVMSSEVVDLNQTCCPFNLHISVGKTKVMHVGLCRDNARYDIGVEGQVFEVVEKFCYLGSLVSSDGGVSSEVKRRIGMALAAFQTLKTSLWKRKEVSLLTKMKVFRAIVLSRLLYGAESWALSAKDLQRLEAFQTFCLRRILRLSWMSYVRNSIVRERCQQPSMEALLRQKRLRWLGHVQRMDISDRLPKQLLWGRLAGTGRKQGGQKKRWVDVCMQDLKELGMRGKWKDHCLHRKEWASQIKAKVCLSRKELQSSVAIECSNCRRVFSREGDRKRHRCDSIRSKAAVAGCVSHGNRRIIPEQIVVGGGSVNGDEEVGGGSVVDVSVGTAAVFTKAAAPLVCSVCQRSFLREGDRKRHRCDSVRSRMLSSGSVFQRRTTIEGGIDDDGDEGPSGDVGDGNLIDGHRHVSGLEHGVGRGGGRAGATGDGRDEGGGRVGVGVGVVVVCQTCGRSFSRLSGLKRHSCDSVRSKKISVSGR